MSVMSDIDAELDNLGRDETSLSRSAMIIPLLCTLLLAFAIWAFFASLDEVSNGTGKVVPSSKEQIIQSLEGGILAELLVKEGDIVEAGQVLARLDPTQTESGLGESAARYRAAIARSIRLQAELENKELIFPEHLKDFPELLAEETRFYKSRRQRLQETLDGLRLSQQLITKELEITQNLQKSGAASHMEVIRLERQQADIALKLVEAKSHYDVLAREELSKANAEAEMLLSVLRGRTDSLTRLTHRSPVRGIVKDIQVTTRGGVIPPNGQLMQIVPLDDNLLVEARISPRDIAFIHPGQNAQVKITAYDYAIYGGLDGKVVTISPDTLQDELRPENVYYRVYIRTDKDYLENKAGKQFAIVPGMIASVDIKTGSKSVMDYLIKPLNRAQEALRER